MKRKSFLFTLLLIFAGSVLSVNAQVASADTSIVQSLEKPDGKGTVKLHQDKRLTDRLARRNGTVNTSAAKDQGYINARGYRIQVFSDNNQRRSKDEAYRKAGLVKGFDPALETYVTFTSPFWRLRVGNFRSFEEANLKLRDLKNAFPQFAREMRIVRDNIRIPYFEE